MTAPHSARRRWTSEEVKQLDEFLNAGKEAAEIAVLLNRSRQAVYALLRARCGVPRTQAARHAVVGTLELELSLYCEPCSQGHHYSRRQRVHIRD